MNLNEYQAQALRTSPDGHDRVLNGCLGLIGESGEIVDVVKKWKFQSGENAELPKDKLIDECGDVLWYCAEVCQGLEDSLTTAVMKYNGRIQILIKTRSIIYTVCNLAAVCRHTYAVLAIGNDSDTDDEIAYAGYDGSTRELCFTVIGAIVDYVRHILVHFCDSSLEEAMERNIEKLKKRYPDGFDPERSLHRPEYANAENERKDGESESVLLFNQRNRTI